MDLKYPFNLSPENIVPNERKRYLHKQIANTFFGKFQQNSNKPKTEYVRSQNDLENIFHSNNQTITDLFCLNENICQVEVNQKQKQFTNLKTNVYIGGAIVAYGRQIIYDYLNLIELKGGILYQVECDSIIFSLPVDTEIPVKISPSLGCFKHEINGEILSFYSFGPKNYSLTYRNHADAQIKTLTRISGLSLKNSLFQNELSEKLFDDFLKNSDVVQKKTLTQLRTKKKKMKIETVLDQFTYSNNLTKRRYLDKDLQELVLFPYGFKKI
jgi:hypothetical protein